MSKKKWLLILLAVLLAIAAVIFVFWDSVAIYIFPKSILSRAVSEAIMDLQFQYERSPVSMLAKYVYPEGLYTGRMELDTQNQLLGPVSYDLTVQADTLNNRLSAEGVVATSQNDLDLSVYLDRRFMALSSQDLLGGAYYGITYDSFPEDIRSIPLLSMFIGEGILSGWDSSVADIQEMMNRSYRLPEIPEISAEDIQRAITAVLLLPGKVERVELPVCGVYANGYRVTYSAKGEQIGEVLGYLMDAADASDAQVSASFYVYENQLIMLQFQGKAGDSMIQCALELMVEDATRTLRMEVTQQGKNQGVCLRHEAKSRNDYLNEAWTVYPNFEAEGEGTEIRYRWEPVMGEMVIYAKAEVTLNLFETEAGLNVQTDHFEWPLILPYIAVHPAPSVSLLLFSLKPYGLFLHFLS